jgi:hypothetical protein
MTSIGSAAGKEINSELRRMVVDDCDIDRIARTMIAQHGSDAVLSVWTKFNNCVDQNDQNGRNTWARIVHRKHEE